MIKNNLSDTVTTNEFVITRVINAPRESVFKAWTEPKQMAEWWGPHTFTNPVCEMDVRPAGAYRIVMRSADGIDYPMSGIYLEIAKPSRLVFTDDVSEHGAEWHNQVNKNRPNAKGQNIKNIITMVTFEEQDGPPAGEASKTRMEVRMRFQSAEDRDSLVKIGMSEGWSQSFERLEKLVAK